MLWSADPASVSPSGVSEFPEHCGLVGSKHELALPLWPVLLETSFVHIAVPEDPLPSYVGPVKPAANELDRTDRCNWLVDR
jgi:hypothetical protein